MSTTLRKHEMFIGGRWTAGSGGESQEIVNPATGKVIAHVPKGTQEDVDRAVAAARKAYDEAWYDSTPRDRCERLLKVAQAIEDNGDELARIESENVGKPLAPTKSEEIPPIADCFRFFAGAARSLEGRAAGEYMSGFTSFVRRESLGVVGSIAPWNYPLMMAAWKLAPALACGNVAILKPAETTPLTALLLAEICQEAELPKGVVAVLPGDGATGAGLVRHPGVDKVAFTGSTRVGREIQAALAGSEVSLTLELGGKSANIVFEDASIDQAVEGIVSGIFFNQGHVCCAGSRLLVQESVREEVVEKLWSRMQRLRIGDPLDKNTDIGAINSAAQLARIEELVACGEREGARRRTIEGPLPERGYWFAPTLFTDVSPAHRIAVEEIFGPVLSVLTFRTQAEAVEKANASVYGLAAGIWTDKGAKAFEVAAALRSGVVWQNTYNRFDPTAAFGGYRESGFGREGGPSGLRPYLRVS